MSRLPVVYLPHGGGPWPFVEGLGEPGELAALAGYLHSVRELTGERPGTLLVISAHWEAPQPTVTASAHPPLVYDYYGFPPASYQITWPAPGAPGLAARVCSLLEAGGIPAASDPARGYDHGTFIPLKLIYPEADIPTVQLSLQAGLDPARHLAIGRALAPLRDEGVFIIGSGMSFHNMRAFGNPAARPWADGFDAWLRDTAAAEPAERDLRLVHWSDAPSARAAHPREEHLLPMMVVAGAAGVDCGKVAYRGHLFGLAVSGYQFG